MCIDQTIDQVLVIIYLIDNKSSRLVPDDPTQSKIYHIYALQMLHKSMVSF